MQSKKLSLAVAGALMAFASSWTYAAETIKETSAQAIDIAVCSGQAIAVAIHEVCTNYMASVGFMLFDGDTNLAPLKDLLQKQGETFELFKKANDDRLAEVEKKGQASADAIAKVEQLNDALTKLSKELKDAQTRADDLEKKFNRPGAGGDVTPEVAEYKQGFDKYFRKGDTGNLHSLEMKALNTQSDPDGGILVPVEIEAAIDRVLTDDVAMRRLALVRAIGAGSYKKPIVTNGQSYGWIGETEDSAESQNPKFSELEFVPGKLYAEPWSTNDMLEDGMINIESWLAEETSIGFAEGEGAAFINGNGIKKPRGLLTYDTVANANWAWGKIGVINSGAAGAFAAADPSDRLIDLIHGLRRGYRNGAAWLMNDLTLAAIRKFKNADGDYIWQPGLQAGVSDTLLGYSVEVDDNMPDVAANSLSIAFGNFNRAYIIVDRRGIAVIRDNLTKKGYTKFHTSKRVGGGVQNYEAVKFMKFAA